MEYLWAFLIFIGIFALTTMATGILGLLIPILYSLLGFILGDESIIMGIGGLLGSFVNYYNANKYIKTQGAMSHAPRYSKIASIGFIVVFVLTIILKYGLKVEVTAFNYWYLIIIAIITWFLLSVILRNRRTETLSSFKNSILKFKIVEKYDIDPKWATYLYFKDGQEGWNQTIPGSFLAKDSENDLTFVHNTKEEALRYAESAFENAQFVEED